MLKSLKSNTYSQGHAMHLATHFRLHFFLTLKLAPTHSAAQHDSFFLKGNQYVLMHGGAIGEQNKSELRFFSQATDGTFNIQARGLQPQTFIHYFSALLF